jgi:hypothetical protein
MGHTYAPRSVAEHGDEAVEAEGDAAVRGCAAVQRLKQVREALHLATATRHSVITTDGDRQRDDDDTTPAWASQREWRVRS